MKDELINAYRERAEQFSQVLATFSTGQFNEVPFENSWTAAQVGEHILKSQSVFPRLLSGNTKATERKPEEKKDIVKNIFLDFSTKMKSPEFILPQKEPRDQKELIEELRNKCGEILIAMQSNDLSKTYLDFELPNLGTFTGLEWGWFITYHTQRHIQQVENIRSELLRP